MALNGSALNGSALNGSALTATSAVEVVPSAGAVGGGGAPGLELPGWAVALPERYARPLREGNPAVIGRLEHGRFLLDLRCIEEAEDEALVGAVRAAAAALGNDPEAEPCG
jgi:L-seryl-tRNA(Ser) seleniumtransferase